MAQRNQFPYRGSIDGATEAFAVTKADADLAEVPRALWIGTGGDLTLRFGTSADVVIKNVPDGALLPIRPTQIRAATTAADIVALL
jgi:hypothetical protein